MSLQSTNQPKVLLTDTNRWTLSARLAMGLADAGCRVAGVCVTPGHALSKTRAVERTFAYSSLHPLRGLTAAIEAFNPDFLIPCCDRSVRHLHDLHSQLGLGNLKLAHLIERSLGAPASYSVVSSRYELLKLAGEEGVRIPRTERLQTPEEMASWQAAKAMPLVLKVDGTWGGGGVRVIHRAGEVQPAMAQLARMFGLKRALKRLVINRDAFWLRPWFDRRPHEMIVQSYIHGRPANCAVACWEGRVLAGISVEVVSSEGATGPASIVRVVDRPEMISAAVRIASRLGISGVFGLDFMIEKGSEAAYLIEMNARTTPLCHLRLGPGRDIVGALWAQLAGQPLPEAPAVTEKNLIAYFPQPADGASELLEAAFLDVPHGQPELLEELRRPWQDRRFLFRLGNWVSRRSADRNGSEAPAGRVDFEPRGLPPACAGEIWSKAGQTDRACERHSHEQQ
ncbi:MAG TPA: ATP-grasp domain-containing protein [Candidatus Aquilonibacter sp.]|nr:ATP-grasp domain-containing protein [Candidatus Aquilonibacter sp.]